jgi:hypothetical protein
MRIAAKLIGQSFEIEPRSWQRPGLKSFLRGVRGQAGRPTPSRVPYSDRATSITFKTKMPKANSIPRNWHNSAKLIAFSFQI